MVGWQGSQIIKVLISVSSLGIASSVECRNELLVVALYCSKGRCHIPDFHLDACGTDLGRRVPVF